MFNKTLGKYDVNNLTLRELNTLLEGLLVDVNILNGDIPLINKYLNQHGVWYGGTVTPFNLVIIMNFRGDQINPSKSVGTGRSGIAAAGIDGIGVYFGGGDFGGAGTSTFNTATRLNGYGYIIGSEINVGTAIYSVNSGANIANKLNVFGGLTDITNLSSETNLLQVFDSNAALLSSVTTLSAEAREGSGGVGMGDIGLFYGGRIAPGVVTNALTIIASDATQVGVDIALGTNNSERSGCLIENLAVYYGGYSNDSSLNVISINEVVKLNSTGSYDSTTSYVGSVRDAAAGVGYGNVGVYYSGYSGINGAAGNTNIVTRLDSLGNQIGLEFSLLSPTDNISAAGISL